MKYLFLALFVFFSAVHLIDCYSSKRRSSAKTKPFLVPLILCYYLFSVNVPTWQLVAALVASWLGDVLLIPSGQKYFVLGGSAFTAAHIFLIDLYRCHITFSSVRPLIVVAAAVVYAAVIAFACRLLWQYLDGFTRFAMITYLCVNTGMNLFALMQLLSHPGLAAALTFLGAILFFTSDVVLFIVRFHKRPSFIWKRHFVIMATYIAAEFLITQGMLLLD